MNLIERVKGILLDPKKEWGVIDQEQPNTTTIITGYVLPLAALAAIAAFIGYGLIGVTNVGIFKVKSYNYGLHMAIYLFVTYIVSVFITAFVIDKLAPQFSSEENYGKSFQLVAYSYTPVLIGGIFHILPSLAIIGSLVGLYGLYLMYIGIPTLKKTPAEKNTPYFLVSLLCTIIVYAIIGLVIGAILRATMGSYIPGINISI